MTTSVPSKRSIGDLPNGISTSGIQPHVPSASNASDALPQTAATNTAAAKDELMAEAKEANGVDGTGETAELEDALQGDMNSMKLAKGWTHADAPCRSSIKLPESTSAGVSVASSRRSRVVFDVEQTENEENHQKRLRADEVSMKKVVDELYERVLADGCLCPFYNNIDMDKLKNQQAKLMMYVFGGMDLVLEEDPTFDLRRIHLRLLRENALTLEHWAAFVKHFEGVVGDMTEIPVESKKQAVVAIKETERYFRPLEPGE